MQYGYKEVKLGLKMTKLPTYILFISRFKYICYLVMLLFYSDTVFHAL